MNLSGCSGLWRTLRELILAKLVSPLLTPTSSPDHLYLPPPSCLLYLTLKISLGVLGCGEHFRNWLLTRLLSPLLTSPLLLVIYISILPLLFYVTLWISMHVTQFCGELFTINLVALSSVLYKDTVREGLKVRGRRLNSTTWEHHRTPDSREH